MTTLFVKIELIQDISDNLLWSMSPLSLYSNTTVAMSCNVAVISVNRLKVPCTVKMGINIGDIHMQMPLDLSMKNPN